MKNHQTKTNLSPNTIFTPIFILSASILATTFAILSGSLANTTHATGVTDEINVTIPASCSLTSVVGSAHTSTIETGVYQDDIGESTFKVYCNDSEGFAVYAVGYTNDTFGNNTLKPTNLASSYAIATGTATSGDTSNWAMKLTAVTGTYAPTIHSTEENSNTYSFTSYHTIPSEYTKVASYSSNTDATTGSSFKSTYAVYASPTQPADSYTGKVKYTVVHPSNADAPVALAMLDTGENVNMKMKSVANNTTVPDTYATDTLIKSFQRSNTLPDDFVATTTNTISLTTSEIPIYIFFDNTDNAGIMYYYARDNATIVANSTLSYLFRYMMNLTEVPGLADWNTGNVTNMSWMFAGGYGFSSVLTDISGLANWDTAKVTNMGNMFVATKITNVDALIPNKNNNPNIWNTGNVTDMNSMFRGVSSLADISGLANWDTAKVTDMSYMFQSAKITNVDALIPNKNNNPNIWNTGNVTNMSYMFCGTSLTDISGLANWDTAKVTNMSNMFDSALSLTDISGLANWDTAKVTDMRYIFCNDTALTDISPIAGWNVSSVTATAGGTTSSNNYFYQMFYSVPSNVTSGFVFTNRAGSINSTGTYVVNT